MRGKQIMLVLFSTVVTACQPFGPSRGQIMTANRAVAPGALQLEVIKVTPGVISELNQGERLGKFSDFFKDLDPVATSVGVGDVLDITIWEAPPAVLFTTGAREIGGSGVQSSRSSTLQGIVVGADGTINIPFVGRLPVVGRSLEQIEKYIANGLLGRANRPQVLVKLAQNETSTVSVVGEVVRPGKVGITPRGERILDVLAEAGGAKQPLNLVTVQLTRMGLSSKMKLSDLVENPNQNVRLARGDIVTLIYQPYSFSILGATAKNDEIKFEALGISLVQGLGRAGGLQDGRANPRGVFVFRWEGGAGLHQGDSRPVVYNFDMKDPSGYLLAQQFKLADKDVIYVANSPVAELQRFINIISSTILPASSVAAIAP